MYAIFILDSNRCADFDYVDFRFTLRNRIDIGVVFTGSNNEIILEGISVMDSIRYRTPIEISAFGLD